VRCEHSETASRISPFGSPLTKRRAMRTLLVGPAGIRILVSERGVSRQSSSQHKACVAHLARCQQPTRMPDSFCRQLPRGHTTHAEGRRSSRTRPKQRPLPKRRPCEADLPGGRTISTGTAHDRAIPLGAKSTRGVRPQREMKASRSRRAQWNQKKPSSPLPTTTERFCDQ